MEAFTPEKLMSDLELDSNHSFEEPVTFKKGQVLFAQGEKSSYLYIVQKGEVGIFLEDRDKLTLLNTVGEKDFIGELSMFSDDKRNATAIALETSSLVVIQKSDVRKILKMCPEWVSNIMLTITDRLRNTVDVLREHRVIDEMQSASQRTLNADEIKDLQNSVKEYKERRGL